jgi:glyoxylase-like metal-dependent hydrolase (beta-lactamase superfamily II)
VVFHDGDAVVAPGIETFLVGGHTRGLQAVRVATARGDVVLASDSSHYYENVEQGRIFSIVRAPPTSSKAIGACVARRAARVDRSRPRSARDAQVPGVP